MENVNADMLDEMTNNPDALEQIGQMMGQDRQTMNQVKQMMKNPQAVKQMKQMLNKQLGVVKNSQKGEKIGRNEPCPCNSGKKYKKCCAISKSDKQ